MKTGISTASLFLKQNTEDAISTIGSLGAECIEIFYQSFYEYRPEFSQKLCVPEGLEVCSVHTLSSQFEPQLFNPSRRVRGDSYYWLDQLMRSAQLVGGRAYTFHGEMRRGYSEPDYDSLASYLAGIVEFCARYGVKLCLENVEWSTYYKPGMFKELKKRIPSLAGVFDIKQARRSGYPYSQYIDDMAGSISHVHLSDADSYGKMCLPGKGVYNFTEVFKRLKDAGFNGCTLIEVYPDDYKELTELKQSLEFLKTC